MDNLAFLEDDKIKEMLLRKMKRTMKNKGKLTGNVSQEELDTFSKYFDIPQQLPELTAKDVENYIKILMNENINDTKNNANDTSDIKQEVKEEDIIKEKGKKKKIQKPVS